MVLHCSIIFNHFISIPHHRSHHLSTNQRPPSGRGVFANLMGAQHSQYNIAQSGVAKIRAPENELHAALMRVAAREWQAGPQRHSGPTTGGQASQLSSVSTTASTSNASAMCTAILWHHGLCTPDLLRLPEAKRAAESTSSPFMLLHLSKCAGTSLLSAHAHAWYARDLPVAPSPSSACGIAVSAKCCWWRERLRSFSSPGPQHARPKVLTQEPANELSWRDARSGQVRSDGSPEPEPDRSPDPDPDPNRDCDCDPHPLPMTLNLALSPYP